MKIKNKQCKICGRTFSRTKLIYNIVQGDYLCLDCYRDQYPNTPKYPKYKVSASSSKIKAFPKGLPSSKSNTVFALK